MKSRLSRKIYPIVVWSLFVLSSVCIALCVFLTANILEHRRQKFPANLGNDRAAALLKSGPPSGNNTKFAVIGDINNGTDTFETVVKRLQMEKDISFLVLLGDCASDPYRDLHMYFIDEFAETGFRVPTFIVAGNHDVAKGKFDYNDFERAYGPSNFAFVYRDDLFIGLGGIHTQEKYAETLAYADKVLQDKRRFANHVFIFMHYPPAPLQYILENWQDHMNALRALFEKYEVTYVVSGHYHRLARTSLNGIVYLITGGGGGNLRYDRFQDSGLFHHLTIIESGGNQISERTIPVSAAGDLFRIGDEIERSGLTRLVPFARKHALTGAAALLFILAVFCFTVVDRMRMLFPGVRRKA